MKKLTCLMLCLFSLVSIAQAETLALREALVLGMEHNFDLQIAGLEVERAEAGVTKEIFLSCNKASAWFIDQES